jgi:CDP-diglyceride synthetase
MNTLLIVLLVLIGISSCIKGFQTNLDKHELSQQVQLYVVIAFLTISILCVILHTESITIELWEYIIVLVAIIALPESFGYFCGKTFCKGCTKHWILAFKKSPRLSWRFFWLIIINKLWNPLYHQSAAQHQTLDSIWLNIVKLL